MKLLLCLFGIMILNIHVTLGQVDSSSIKLAQLRTSTFTKINSNTAGIDNALIRKTQKYLSQISKEENRLKIKMQNKDSLAASHIFEGSETKYAELKLKLKSPLNPNIQNPLHEYVPGLDSTQAALRYLSKIDSKLSGFPVDKLKQIQLASAQIQQLQARLQSANDIEQLIKQHEQQLSNQLSQYGFGKELAGIKKDMFYYQQQLQEYKQMLHEPDKLERKVIGAVNDNPAFKTFMGKYSYLAQLFGVPDTYGSNLNLDGLQTRALIDQLVAGRLGSSPSSGPDPSQFMQQQIQTAEQAMSTLKNKLQQLGTSGGGADIVQPNFQPNSQHTKSFMQRIEYGFDLQSQGSSSFQVATINIGLSAGYKFDDRTSAGLGIKYSMGVGHPVSQVHISNQGLGFRTYIDKKIKFNFWFSGGFEYNYLSAFKNLNSIKNLDLWQRSALFGLMKTIRVTKNRQSTIQLLYDILYKEHLPPSSPLVFRMGYKF